MKKWLFIAALLMPALANLQAQTCEEVMLPYFHYDTARLRAYPAEKLEIRCSFARAALYESDTIPAGADVLSITEVVNNATGQALPANYVVDLTTLMYYHYNFQLIQGRYTLGNKTFCFPTPASQHPYLVLRSIDDMYRVSFQEMRNR